LQNFDIQTFGFCCHWWWHGSV